MKKEIPSIAKEYVEFMKEEIEKVHPDILLYGSTVYGRETSDLDILYIVKNYNSEDYDRIKNLTIEFQKRHNMDLDEEVPYSSKLIYTEADVESMLKNSPFKKINGKYHISPIEKTSEFLSSKEMKDRLLLNILTTRSLLLVGDEEKINQYRQSAWELLVNIIMSYNNLLEVDLDNFIQLLYTDKNSKQKGEMYLGYKTNIEEKQIDLEEDCKNIFNTLEKIGKLERQDTGKFKRCKNKHRSEEEMDINAIIEDICQKELEGKKVAEQPLCILLGGLPGSGKSNLIKKIQEEYSERDFVIIDADDYRELHPDYEELRNMPERAVTETCEFANKIEEKLIRKSIEQKRDIISVTTLRATEAIDKILYTPAKQAGYNIEAHIMSVPIRESSLSAQIRYERQLANGECPRFTPVSFIEGSYQGIKDTIQILQNKEDNPVIKIYRRGQGENSMPIEVYSNRNKNNRYSCPVDAFANSYKVLNEIFASQKIKELYDMKKERNANSIEYYSLKRLEELFDIEKNREK